MRKLLPLATLSLILGLAYGRTLAPGLTWANDGADGGDLITAVATGGVPHPSGYPLFLILGGFFQKLPIGTLAFRTNLMSAVCAISAAGLLYWFIDKQLSSPFSAFLGALAFGLSPLVWSQAVITEVYTLHALLVMGCIYSFLSQVRKPITNLGLGLLFGLALGNHLTILLLAPFLLIKLEGAGEHKPTSGLSYTSVSLGLRFLGAALGSLIYLVLPLRASSWPAVNWGNPVTWKNFIWLVSGQLYEEYIFTLSAVEVVQRFQGWMGLLLHQFTFIGLILGLYGLFTKMPQSIRMMTLWLFVSSSLFSIFYASSDSFVYLIPACIAFAVWIGIGLHDISTAVSTRSQWVQKGILLMLMVGIISRGLWLLPEVDASQDRRAETLGNALMEYAPQNALLFVDNDQETFTLWYYHYALGHRPDTSIIVEGMLQFDWYRQTLQRTYPELEIPDKGDTLSVSDVADENSSRPSCFVNHQQDEMLVCEITNNS